MVSSSPANSIIDLVDGNDTGSLCAMQAICDWRFAICDTAQVGERGLSIRARCEKSFGGES
jgi:hypothetical protein